MSILVAFLGTMLLVLLSIEGGYRLGRSRRRLSDPEKESPVSAIEGSVLGLLAFILAFTFGIASNRLDARKQLVREEANAIRTVWYRSDFLPEDARAQTHALLRTYVHDRALAFQSTDQERVGAVLARAELIQGQLWSIALGHVRTDMPSDIGALYLESLNEMATIHASRVALGLQLRIPPGIWFTLGLLTALGMGMVGYQAGLAESRRSIAMHALALAFACVVALISSLDQPVGGFSITRVSQQPLIDLSDDIDSHRVDEPR
jgi:hypothetical protein